VCDEGGESLITIFARHAVLLHEFVPDFVGRGKRSPTAGRFRRMV
jgi:hypothetical protein